MSTDLLFMPAVKAAALIRARKLSPVDYVDTVLTAIDRAQSALNCFRVVMAEETRREEGRGGGGQGWQARAIARRARQHKRPFRRQGRAHAARLGDLR